MEYLSITTDLLVEIEGREQVVVLAVEYACCARIPHYFVEAITETGFNLCNSSYGYLKYSVPMGNTRLRSETSIANDMLHVLESYARCIQNLAPEIVLSGRHVRARISGTDLYTDVRGLEFTKASNVRSSQSGQVLSWYEHDVFKQGEINVSVYRQTDGQLRFEASEYALYDLPKLRALVEGERFRNSNFAFFFYNEARRLLGMPVKGDPKRMSGFMPSDRSE